MRSHLRQSCRRRVRRPASLRGHGSLQLFRLVFELQTTSVTISSREVPFVSPSQSLLLVVGLVAWRVFSVRPVGCAALGREMNFSLCTFDPGLMFFYYVSGVIIFSLQVCNMLFTFYICLNVALIYVNLII